MTSIDARLERARRHLPVQPGAIPTLPEFPGGIVDFCVNGLGDQLMPAQGTFLKVVCLELEHLTEFDHQMLDRWEEGFTADRGAGQWVGTGGIVPGVRERMGVLREAGHPYFNELVIVLGRRAGKGFVISRLLGWMHLQMLRASPYETLAIDRAKALTSMVFAPKAEQAKRDQFGDVLGAFTTTSVFAPFLGKHTTRMVSLLTFDQLAAGATPGVTKGALVIQASETTETAGRGPAIPALVLDESGHVAGAGSTADASAIMRSARPATAQFGERRLVINASSPASKTGPLHEYYLDGLAFDPGSGEPLDDSILVIQGPSWMLYKGWERSASIPMWPGGRPYPTPKRPSILEHDAEVRAARRRDPHDAAVEWYGEFRSSKAAYLPLESVHKVFADVDGYPLPNPAPPILSNHYVAHADPARSGANFAFALGHAEVIDGRPHVFFDLLHHWRPGDYDDGVIRYPPILDQIYAWACEYHPQRITFDQYNSAQAIDELNDRLARARLRNRCTVEELTATQNSNWRAAEAFKTMAAEGLIHAPHHDQARLELEYLELVADKKVRAPTTGPVQNDDMADAMFAVVDHVTQTAHGSLHEALSRLHLVPGVRGPNAPPTAATHGYDPRFAPTTEHDAEIFSQLSIGNALDRAPGAAPRYKGEGHNPGDPTWK